MDLIIEYSSAIMRGTGITISLAICALVVAVLMGLMGAGAKMSKSTLAYNIASSYTTLIRGVPDLVLMLIFYYGGQLLLNNLGEATGYWDYIEINTFVASFLTIGFILGAYMTETFRGAILAIPRGQIEAGVASGMTKVKIFTRIIWPQMVRLAMPGFTNNWLVLLKTTALVSVLGLEDLVYIAFTAGRSNRQIFTFMFAVLVIYLVLTALSDVGLRKLNRKYNVGIQRA